MVAGAHNRERTTAMYVSQGLLTDQAGFSLILPRNQSPTGALVSHRSLASKSEALHN